MKTLFGWLALSVFGIALAQGNMDQMFFEKLAQGGMAEIDAAKLAQSKAQRSEVKTFAQMMLADHGKANAKLKALAAKKSVQLPSDTDSDHKAAHQKLAGLAGNEFDTAYIQGQIDDHEATVELLKYEIESGGDADAKAFSKELLPTVKGHLEKIKAIAKSAGVAR